MAGVAGFGAVHEIIDAVVLIDGLRLLMRGCGMAIDASEVGIVRGNLMAIVAGGRIRFVMRNREIIAVIKSGAQPGRSGVARVASGGVAGGNVVRYGTAKSLRAIPLRNVATVTSGVCGSE